MTREDAGFSLVEVLMATAITLVVLALTTQAFLSGLNANNAIELLTGTNQNLQSAATYLSQDLTKAGQDIPLGGITIPNGTGATAIVRPIPGTVNFPASTVLYAVRSGDALGPLVQDSTASPSTTRSDVVTIVYADRTLPELALDSVTLTSTSTTAVVHYTPLVPGNIGVQLNTTTANTVLPGDLFMFTNANGTTVQEVTSSTAQSVVFGNTDVLKFNQPALPIGQGGILTLVPTSTGYPPVTMRRLTMATYYVDRTSPTQPLLMRRLGGTAPVAIAVGVENLQLQYDLFVTGAAALSVTNTPTNPNDIRKVEVYLGARSEDKSRQTNDYVRNSMVTQITVRSLGLFDVYPGT
jgi:prepilin-type N-terminal cleavage/methylation domain-containing protein